MDNYAQREAYALESQGLTALMPKLDRFVVEQTGGFCMALVRYGADGIVTVVTGETVDNYTVGTYTLEAWTGPDSEEPLTIAYDLTVAATVALTR